MQMVAIPNLDGNPDAVDEKDGPLTTYVTTLEVKNQHLGKMDWKKLIILAVVFHIYLMFGAGVFHYLEKGQEEDTRLMVRKLKEDILANYSCIDSDVLEKIISVAVMASQNGINPTGNVSSPSNWDFSSAFFFSGITVTTIGYGHISPTTRTGQTFCIVFALIGIPLCGIMLTGIGEKLSNLTEMAERPFRSKLKKKWQRVIFHLFIIGGSMFVFFITMPALIFERIEGWELNESWYYCFITLTTIGFGDYVVDQNADIDYLDIYVVMAYFWIIFGLAYLALIIQQIGRILASTGKVVQDRVSTTVSTVATASMATGRVVSDRVQKQISNFKDTLAYSDSSDSAEEGGAGGEKETPKSMRKKPSWRQRRASSKRDSYPAGVEVTVTDDKINGEYIVRTTNINGKLFPGDCHESESTTSQLSVVHENDVELDEMDEEIDTTCQVNHNNKEAHNEVVGEVNEVNTVVTNEVNIEDET